MTRSVHSRIVVAAWCALATAFAPLSASAAAATINVDVDKPSHPVPPTFYGLMTEEINHSYDGGLYAELIQNRTFQDDGKSPVHWSPVGGAKLTLDRDDPVNAANPVSLHIDLLGDTPAGAANEGFWGIPVRPDTQYAVSFYAKGSGGFAGPVTAAIVGNDGKEFAKATTDAVGTGWKKYTLTLKTTADVTATKDAKFSLTATGSGAVSFNLISLFPPTYMDTPGGLRPDLMKLMADMKPSFIRLPGGNYLEGDTFATRYNWKQQIGPVDERPGHRGCWGYRSSDGMGLPQMLLWCKQLKAEPVLAVFAGYTLNHDHVDAGPKMQPFVDEALEEIEYVTGGPETTWGSKRVADGFPEPFKLTYVEIGNEDWFDRSPSYDGRFTQMYDAIKAKYPNLKLIATAPVKSRKPDLYDDHFYQSPTAMVTDSNHYDPPADPNAPLDIRSRNGRFQGTFVRGQVPDVFCGEWATQQGRPTPTHRAGLADAIWLMGLERNSDLVKIECYAPLFANVNPHAWQWGTNLIGYDAMSAFGSPSYYAQLMFGQNKPDQILPATLDAPVVAEAPVAPHGAVGIGTWHTDAEFKDLEVTDPDGHPLLKSANAQDLSAWRSHGKWTSESGSLKPANAAAETWATVGDPSWTNYTIHVKAKKNSGEEGFLVLWHAANEQNFNWWNIGGWGNTRTATEISREGNRGQYGPDADFKVETGKWYDLRIEVRDKTAKCYIDDKLVSEATDPAASPGPQMMYVDAGYSDAGKSVIVKVVNYSKEPIETTLNLRGVKSIKPEATATVLAGDPDAVNTIGEPTKVAPKDETITDASPAMKRVFPPYSLTVLRLNVGE